MPARYNLGIDASNIRAGGGLTHLSCLLDAAVPETHNIGRVIVWGGGATLAALPGKDWLDKVYVPMLDASLPVRVFWQQALLPGQLKLKGCSVLFSPGGTIPGASPVPVVTMSQNLLPFEAAEYSRYPFLTPFRLKLGLLKIAQSYSMRNAAGVIFLAEYARKVILPLIGGAKGRTAIIPHGLDARFFCEPRKALPIESFSPVRPFRIKYVSTVDNYKHQIEAAIAVAALRAKGLPAELEFIGSARPSYLEQLNAARKRLDPGGEFLRYKGGVDFKALHLVYREADLFLFASSCENLPNILIEAMASGLPIVCSNKGPMPEVLGEAGLYFDPESPAGIEGAIRKMIASPRLRDSLAGAAYRTAKGFSWTKCAADTFAFIDASK